MRRIKNEQINDSVRHLIHIKPSTHAMVMAADNQYPKSLEFSQFLATDAFATTISLQSLQHLQECQPFWMTNSPAGSENMSIYSINVLSKALNGVTSSYDRDGRMHMSHKCNNTHGLIGLFKCKIQESGYNR